MTHPLALLRAALVAAALGLASTPTSADSDLILLGSGHKTSHIADLTEDMRYALGPSYGPEFALGFSYETVAVAGLDVWTWNGRYCVYDATRCDRVSAARAAVVLGIEESALPRPLSYTFKPGLIVALLLGALLYAWSWRRQQALLLEPGASDDPRYQRALEMVMKDTKSLPVGAQAPAARERLEEALDYLTGEGIDREEGRRVLSGMINTVVEFRRRTGSSRSG